MLMTDKAVLSQARNVMRRGSCRPAGTFLYCAGERNKRTGGGPQGNRISNLSQEFGEEVVVPAGTFELAAV
jgi:hypothetical protein